MPNPQRDNEYAGELLRISDILKDYMSHERLAEFLYELEKYAKENDRVVEKIITNPMVVRKYNVEKYDGLELSPRPPKNFPIHFIRDGLFRVRRLDKNSLLASVFINSDGSYNMEEFFKWFNRDLEFNKLRLDNLGEKGSLTILDPTKVRIRKLV